MQLAQGQGEGQIGGPLDNKSAAHAARLFINYLLLSVTRRMAMSISAVRSGVHSIHKKTFFFRMSQPPSLAIAPSALSCADRCLDAGSEFPPSIQRPALVSAMLAFLSSLPEAVVPVAAVKAVESELAAHRVVSGASGRGAGGAAGGAWGETFLRALSPSQHNTFLYVA